MTKSSSLRSPRQPPSLSVPQEKRRRMNDSTPDSHSPFQPTKSRYQPTTSSTALPSPHELHYQLSQNLSAISKRYQTALAHDPLSIQPVLYPADTFFARPTLICVVCKISFPTHDHLVQHIQHTHNTGYNPAPSLSTPFSTPATTTTTPISTARPYSGFLPTQLPPLQATQQLPTLQPPSVASLGIPPVVSSYQPLQTAVPPVAPVPASGLAEADAPWRKSKFYCDICEISCDTNDMLQVHFGGQRHRKKAEREAALRNAMTRILQEEIIKLPKRTYICNLCKTDIDSDNALLQHLESGKHTKNVEAKRHDVLEPRVSPSQAYEKSLSQNLSASQSPSVGDLLQKRSRVPSPVYASQGTVPNSSLNSLSPRIANSPTRLPSLSNQVQATPIPPSIDEYRISPTRVAPNLRPLVNLSDSNSALFVPPPISTTRTTGSSVPASKLRCEICSVTCNSQDPFNSHLASAKHKKKQAALNGQAASNVYTRCDICNITCCGDINFQAHLRGRMHTKKLKALHESPSAHT